MVQHGACHGTRPATRGGRVAHIAARRTVCSRSRILVQVARALSYIHDRGLIHRDITPGNIMVRPDGVVKLMDFGVVKDMGADLTAVGSMVGTVSYISPEQIEGSTLDARADLYSLGAVLYFMLTGNRPFNARTLQGFLEKHLKRLRVHLLRWTPQSHTSQRGLRTPSVKKTDRPLCICRTSTPRAWRRYPSH